MKMAETNLKGTVEEQILIMDECNVPDWLLTEILIRLPLKQVFMLKCISKRWFTMISDPSFSRIYACNQSQRYYTFENISTLEPSLP